MQIDEVCKVAKALSEPNRIEILNLVSNEEMYAFEILKQFDITQPTLSHHMKLLTDSGLLYMRKEGKMSYSNMIDSSYFPMWDYHFSGDL